MSDLVQTDTIEIELTVNGERRTLRTSPLARLLDVLREELGLTGTKEGCGEGECGACTVLVDGSPVNSCLQAVCQVEGASISTVEDSGLETLREAYLEEGGAQCGICTPGMIVMTRAWIEDCQREGRPIGIEEARKALAGDLSSLKELRQQSTGDVVDAAGGQLRR